MPVNSKNKGNKNEREVAKLFKKWTGYDFTKVPTSGGLRWKRTTDTAGDIICSDNIHYRRFQFSIEAKFHEDIRFEHIILPNTKVKVLEFWTQAKEDAQRAGKIPLLFMRYNHMPKNMHFVGVNKQYLEEVLDKHITNNLGRLHILTKEAQVTILNSEDFFNCNYLNLYKQTRKWNKNQKESGA